jgi:hypothetical protein
LQFNLRSVLLVTAAVAVVCAIAAPWIRAWPQERQLRLLVLLESQAVGIVAGIALGSVGSLYFRRKCLHSPWCNDRLLVIPRRATTWAYGGAAMFTALWLFGVIAHVQASVGPSVPGQLPRFSATRFDWMQALMTMNVAQLWFTARGQIWAPRLCKHGIMIAPAGFLAELKAGFPGIKVISADQYAGPTRDTAKRAAENLLNRYGKDLDGMFVVNESSTSGMLLALQDAGLAGKVKFIGFDSNQAFVDALRKGEMNGFVLQNPFRMSGLAVEALVDHLQGKTVPKLVDTGVFIVTPANLDSPEVQTLLKPPLDQYLKPGE